MSEPGIRKSPGKIDPTKISEEITEKRVENREGLMEQLNEKRDEANGRISSQAESKRLENGNSTDDRRCLADSRTDQSARDETLSEEVHSDDQQTAVHQTTVHQAKKNREGIDAIRKEFIETLNILDDPVAMPELESDGEKMNDEEVALDLSDPAPDIMEYARKVLGETDEVKCQTLQEFRDMIYERGECLPHRMDDDFLIRFLRARNFNVHRAHRLITNYHNFKEEHPEIHCNINPLEMRHIGEDDVMTVPAYRTQCGRRMMIYRMGNWDPRKYSIEELFKATVIVLELGILEPRAQILGGVVIFDLEGISMAHAWAITPQVASMVLSLMVSAFPMKTHAIHIVNQSWVFDAIFAVFRPLLHSRMRERIFFHGTNLESLHKHISPERLPKKYGGTRDELAYYKWIDSLSKVPRIVKQMHQLGYIVPDEMRQTLLD